MLVYVPSNSAEDWSDREAIRNARATPGVQVELDPEGVLIRRMGMKTSGSVALYDPGGVLRFHGGITISRGHEGPNLGTESILAILEGREPPVAATPVYGCPISE
jgi:hypothetical protein